MLLNNDVGPGNGLVLNVPQTVPWVKGFILAFGEQKCYSALESTWEFHMWNKVAETYNSLNQWSVTLIDKHGSGIFNETWAVSTTWTNRLGYTRYAVKCSWPETTLPVRRWVYN